VIILCTQSGIVADARHRLPARAAAEVGAHRDDLLDIFREALVEHLVRLVEHQVLDVAKPCEPVAREVEEPPRAPDDHVRRVAQATGLRTVADAGRCRSPCAGPGRPCGSPHSPGGQLAGRSHDKRSRPWPGARQAARHGTRHAPGSWPDPVGASITQSWRPAGAGSPPVHCIGLSEAVLAESGGLCADARRWDFKRCQPCYLGTGAFPLSRIPSLDCRVPDS